jgi:hypothetical protein
MKKNFLDEEGDYSNNNYTPQLAFFNIRLTLQRY